MTPSKATVKERVARYQRRYTGPWQTANHEVGPLDVSYRYRRRRRAEFAELDVAWHDLWTHALVRGVLMPIVTRLGGLIPQ